MNALLLTGLLAASALFLPRPAGDGLRRERLPADVDFVMHFDFEGFKQTELWRSLSEHLDEGELKADLADLHDLRTRFGIDPLTDVRAVTLFKVEKEEDPTVVLFSTTTKVDEALKNFQKERGYARLSEGGIELHTWKEDGDDVHIGEDDVVFAYVHAPSGTDRVVVLASRKESALRAARVLRGQDPSHASAGTLLTISPAPGSFLYLAAAEIPHLDEIPPASQILGLAQGIQLDLGEAGGFLRGHMGLLTGSPEDAFNISNVINGLVSLVRLAGSEAGDALELLTGLRFNTRGSEVLVDFEFGVTRLLEILQALDHGDADEDDEDDGDEEDEKAEHNRRVRVK